MRVTPPIPPPAPALLFRTLLLCVWCATPAPAATTMQAVHARDWSAAQASVRDYADPVAEKLVTYYRLLTPGAAGADEIAAFLAQNPDWPNQDLLERRRQEAIAAEPDPTRSLAQCEHGPIALAGALQKCAAAFAAASEQDSAIRDARRAWVVGFAEPGADQTAFLDRWKGALRPEDEWERFKHLISTSSPEVSRQISRLAPARHALANAWLAFQRGAPDALALTEKVPAEERTEPGLLLAESRWLRRQNRATSAAALWGSSGTSAEDAAQRAALLQEREILARQLLADGKPRDALALVGDQAQTEPEHAADADFLAGFIALERLHDPAAAIPHFEQLAERGSAAITVARAHYWLGRALASEGKDPRAEYDKAAQFPTTFYGQLAAVASGESPAALSRRIDALRDPGFTPAQAWTFAANELVRAGAILAAWGEFGRARAFLQRMSAISTDPAGHEIAARLAMALGLPDAAVSIARRAGAAGVVLPVIGWPMAVIPPDKPVDPAVTLAVIRQESSFDAGVVSSAGARGLMQLMPATAALQAERAGQAATQVALSNALTADPARNMELGTAYLGGVLDRFSGSLPLAVAAYNAGPRRVDQWLAQNGDPRVGAISMIDWIELIPFGETRNYVQRVLESVVIYAARRGEHEPPLIGQWSR